MKRTVALSFLAATFAFLTFSQKPARAASVTLPATNQTLCYDTAGNVISCIGTKQDGATRMGASWPAHRFTNNGDGTFQDSLTGLVWLADNGCYKTASFGGPITTFLQALDAVANIADGQCGLSDGSVRGDWRLPNVNEALSLYDSSAASLATGVPTKQNDHWAWHSMITSTTHKKDTTSILVLCGDGTIQAASKNSANSSWGNCFVGGLFAVRSR